MRGFFLTGVWAVLCSCCLTTGVFAQHIERIPDHEQSRYGEMAHVNGDYQTMKNIRRYWRQEVERLNSFGRDRLEFALVGGYEGILKVTIPSDEIFVACDTLMTPNTDGLLYPLIHFLRGSDALASVIVSCYSDNNGSEAYLDRLTASRAAVIGRWISRQGVDASRIRCYGWAGRSPLTDNSSMQKRERNRRVSLYLVPNKHMLKLAKRGRL